MVYMGGGGGGLLWTVGLIIFALIILQDCTPPVFALIQDNSHPGFTTDSNLPVWTG